MSLDCKILEIAVIHCTVDSYNWNPLADKQLTSWCSLGLNFVLPTIWNFYHHFGRRPVENWYHSWIQCRYTHLGKLYWVVQFVWLLSSLQDLQIEICWMSLKMAYFRFKQWCYIVANTLVLIITMECSWGCYLMSDELCLFSLTSITFYFFTITRL